MTLPSVSTERFVLPYISPNNVLRYLRTLKPSLSHTRWDTTSFFKDYSNYLAAPFAHIFNISTLQGQIPAIWNNSFVTPIPKSATCNLVSHFRPSKKELLESVTKLNHIAPGQHGFLPRASTCTQLLSCTRYWIETLNSGKNVDIVSFNLSKAFNRVCHSLLLARLEKSVHRESHREACCRRYFLFYTCNSLDHLKTDNRINVAGFADDIKVAAIYALVERHEAQVALNKSVEKMLS
ncbi:unnamed protein product [Haemonchus placei]|uniref:Reverse transcriptase domain-containing protein n=1 Tax=Haemonchus placei TaxID=6290 RepID=A0A0N4W7I7_HAEPC|nr:unnamed protein product [Haemonchus placei]